MEYLNNPTLLLTMPLKERKKAAKLILESELYPHIFYVFDLIKTNKDYHYFTWLENLRKNMFYLDISPMYEYFLKKEDKSRVLEVIWSILSRNNNLFLRHKSDLLNQLMDHYSITNKDVRLIFKRLGGYIANENISVLLELCTKKHLKFFNFQCFKLPFKTYNYIYENIDQYKNYDIDQILPIKILKGFSELKETNKIPSELKYNLLEYKKKCIPKEFEDILFPKLIDSSDCINLFIDPLSSDNIKKYIDMNHFDSRNQQLILDAYDLPIDYKIKCHGHIDNYLSSDSNFSLDDIEYLINQYKPFYIFKRLKPKFLNHEHLEMYIKDSEFDFSKLIRSDFKKAIDSNAKMSIFLTKVNNVLNVSKILGLNKKQSISYYKDNIMNIDNMVLSDISIE